MKENNLRMIEVSDFLFRNPGFKREDVVSEYGDKWRVSKRTIDRLMKKAREYNLQRQQRREKAKDEVLIETAIEAVKEAILSREEALKTLSAIAREGKLDINRIRAIDKLSQLEGWDAPAKSEITGRDGKDINGVQLLFCPTPLSEKDIAEIKEIQNGTNVYAGL